MARHKEVIDIDYNKKMNQYIGSVLSRLPALFKKDRQFDGIKYWITPENIRKYMDIKNYPYDSEHSEGSLDTLYIKGNKITKLKEPIIDVCKSYNLQKYVSYTCTEKIGVNYCEECVAYEGTHLIRLY